jgi:hypothetical protein
MSQFFEYFSFFAILMVSALWCWGVFTLFHDGYFLDWFGNYFRREDDNSPPNYKGTWFTKPLFDCPPCMASFHGGIIGLWYFGLDWSVLPFVICLCGLNFIVKSILFPEYE